MNFLLEFTSIKCEVWQQIAQELKRTYPGSKFVAITFLAEVKKYLEEQQEVKYEAVIDMGQVLEDALSQDIDHRILEEFERTIPEKSLWRFFAMDRQWGHCFVKNAIFPNVMRDSSQENALKVATAEIRIFKKILTEHKIDVVLPACGNQSMSVPILEHYCKLMKIPYLLPVETRVQKYFALSSNKELVFDQINATFREYLRQYPLDIPELKKAEDCYEQTLSDLTNPNVWYKTSTATLKPEGRYFRFLAGLIKATGGHILYLFEAWGKKSKMRPYFRVLGWDRLKARLLFHYQKLRLCNPKFYAPYDKNEKYVYFPLQVSPEYVIQVGANIWSDQLYVIDVLAKSIPASWKIVIKEHPGGMKYRIRPLGFYEAIKKYPNVKFVPIWTSTREIMSHSQCVITLASTTGLEALMCHKPVINFLTDIYSVTDLCKVCRNIVELSTDIRDVVDRVARITTEEKKKRMVCLFAAVIHHGYWINDPIVYMGEKAPTQEGEIQDCARKTVHAIKEYLEAKRAPETIIA